MKISKSDAKTKPGSLIAQGLSGLNVAKIAFISKTGKEKHK